MFHVSIESLLLLGLWLQRKCCSLGLMLIIFGGIVSCYLPEGFDQPFLQRSSGDQEQQQSPEPQKTGADGNVESEPNSDSGSADPQQLTLNSNPAIIISKNQPVRILLLGDSLTSGYLLASKEEAYPHLTEVMLKAQGYNVEMDNRSIKGLRAEGAVAELRKYFADGASNVTHVFLALGANNGLDILEKMTNTMFSYRASPLHVKIANLELALDTMVHISQRQGAKVMIAGVQIPSIPPAITLLDGGVFMRFHGIFSVVAKKHSIPLWPNLLQGVIGELNLNSADALHPNQKGHKIMARNFYTFLTKQGPPI
ncbi:MAG: GDSL-type esterase/lipase family protein [Proteobacteria bacterium]|nr:GDSL-type esterase/lipase family protein [Pseudomonadota bacterium]